LILSLFTLGFGRGSFFNLDCIFFDTLGDFVCLGFSKFGCVFGFGDLTKDTSITLFSRGKLGFIADREGIMKKRRV
jgi:hypothetical protein